MNDNEHIGPAERNLIIFLDRHDQKSSKILDLKTSYVSRLLLWIKPLSLTFFAIACTYLLARYWTNQEIENHLWITLLSSVTFLFFVDKTELIFGKWVLKRSIKFEFEEA